jgi:NAD(P)-dependent dehydrogenase (short-subunit alcohol dehydrogenase family)
MTSENRTVVITGGTKGVGRAVAQHLAAGQRRSCLLFLKDLLIVDSMYDT